MGQGARAAGGAAVDDPARRRHGWAARIGAALYGLVGLFCLLPAGFSAMMFDAPGSEDNPLTVALVAGLLAAPVVLLASAALLATAGARRGRRLTLVAFWLPAVLLAYLAAVVIGLDRLCGGSFVCR